MNDQIGIKGKVVALVRNEQTGETQRYETTNIVTDAGDTYYAQMSANESPTNAFTDIGVATALSGGVDKSNIYSEFTMATGGKGAVEANYPKSNDGDSANTGKAVDAVTWKKIFSAGTITGSPTITHVGVMKTTTGGSDAVLSAAAFGSSFVVTPSDSLTVYVNHLFTGA